MAKPLEPPTTSPPKDAPYRTRLKVRMLQIAERILEEDGLEGLQARRVAKEADCSVGTIYNVFNSADAKGLEGLIIAANTQTLRAFGRNAELAMRRAGDGTLEDKLMALALAYLDFAIAHRKRLQAVFDFQIQDPEGEAAAPYDSDQARLFAMIERTLEMHVADASERARTARAMFAAVHGIVAMAIDRKLGPFDVAETERQVRFVVQAMARGLPLTRQGGGHA
jgi:AcrR family transcriptional regulator